MTVDITSRGFIGGSISSATNGSSVTGPVGPSSGGVANPTGGCNTALLQKQMSFKSSVGAAGGPMSKADEIEVIESGNADGAQARYRKHAILRWICCAPCIWLRTSTTVHKFALTTATLLVTSLLVASPILFLISTAPSQLPRDCYSDDEDCMPTIAPPPECHEQACRFAASSIQAKLNWNVDPCKEFKEFSCSSTQVASLRATRSAQEAVDIQMQQLLQHNTTSGPFRKLGRLYGSCLRQTANSSTIQLVLEHLGGYLPIGALGPSTIAPLISKIYELGPTPLIDIYFDLSYGRKPHVLLIIGDPGTSAPILENMIRWTGPKAAPYRLTFEAPTLLNDVLDSFLPSGLSYDQKMSEKEAITTFIEQLNKIRVEHAKRGFWNSSVLYNVTSLQEKFPVLNWTSLIPSNWTGPIVVRNAEYLKAVEILLSKYPTRVSHNSILLIFALGILPQGYPDPVVCTKATMWALPEITSALFVAQHSSEDLKEIIKRTDIVFRSLKAHLKRAPSLKGAALVKLSALKIQINPWEGFTNFTFIIKQLESIEITSDNWFENVLKIYKRNKIIPDSVALDGDSHDAWAYPIVAKIFYDSLSHSIVVPLSVILVPYFDSKLPPYVQYASVGVAIAKEILRSITKSFEDKAMRCVPNSVNVFSNYSRMDILIHSGGMQIAYHSMLSLTGPIKGMARLPGLNLTPTQIFFLVSAQELCAESAYVGIDTDAPDFGNILGWLVAQGGSATDVFKCPNGSMINAQKTCNVL